MGFDLSWDAGSELGHELRYRAAGVEEWLEPIAVDAGLTVSAVVDLEPGASYEVQLRAVDRNGVGSPWAPRRPLPVRVGLAPGPVGSVSAVDSPPDGIEVSWSAPADPGSGVSGERVEWTGRSPAGSGFTAQADHAVPAGRTGYVIDIAQLEKGAPYWMRVVAFNPVGDGEPSEIVEAMATSAPGAVTDLRAEADDEQLALRWAAPRDSGGTAVTGYGIRYRLSPGGSWRSWPHDGIATSALVTGLTNGMTYELGVRAANDVGEGPWSSASAVPSLAALQPTGAAATAAGGGRGLRVSWTPPTKSGLERYEVRWQPEPGQFHTGTEQQRDVAATETSVVLSGLVAGVEYRVRVEAHFDDGTTGSSPDLVATPRPAQAPLAAPGGVGFGVDPSDRSAAEVTPQLPVSLIVVSTAPPATPAQAPVLFRELEWKSQDAASYQDRVRVDADSQSVDGFVLGQAYDLRLRAWNLDGPGAWSNTSRVLVAFAPDPPGLGSPVAADEQMTLSWDPPSFTGGVPLTGYAVQYLLTGGDWQDHPHSGTTEGTVIGRLRNGLLYLARVAAVNAAGAGDWSAPVAARPLSTPGHARLFKPDGQLSFGGDAQIKFYWWPPSNDRGATIDDGGLTIESYQTEYKPSYAETAFTPGPTIIPEPTDGPDAEYELRGRGERPHPRLVHRHLRWRQGRQGSGLDRGLHGRLRGRLGRRAQAAQQPPRTRLLPCAAVVSKLRNFFGRYCTQQIAKDAAFSSDSVLASPWAHGGCKPDPPTAVAAGRGATSLTVSWAPPDSMRGGAITEYIVQWKSADSGDIQEYPADTAGFGATARQVMITELDTLSYEITGLTAGDTHDVRVRAVNATDSSNWVETKGTVAVATPPTRYRVSGLLTAMEVSWAPPADNGGSAVTSYVVQWKATGVTGEDQYSETERRAVITDLTDPSHTIEGLTTGQRYTVRVYAVTALGDGEHAEASAVPGSPGAFSDVRVDPGTCDNSEVDYLKECTYSFTVLWDPPTQGAGLVTGYDLQWRRPGSSWGQNADTSGSETITDGSATSHVVEPTDLSSVVEVRIRPLSGTLPGPWRNVSFLPGKPTKVRDASVTYDATAEEFNFSWTPPRFTGGGPIIEYVLTFEQCLVDDCYGAQVSINRYVEEILGPEVRSHTIDWPALSENGYWTKLYAIAQDEDDDSRKVYGMEVRDWIPPV